LFIAVKILFVNEKEACSVEYQVLNPYCSLIKIELVVIWSRSLAYTSFSITSPFLKTGLIMAYFNLSGNIPIFKIALQIHVSADIMYGALNFSIQIEISSYPPVFFDFKDLIIFSIS